MLVLTGSDTSSEKISAYDANGVSVSNAEDISVLEEALMHAKLSWRGRVDLR